MNLVATSVTGIKDRQGRLLCCLLGEILAQSFFFAATINCSALKRRDWRQMPPLSIMTKCNQMLSLVLKELCLQVLSSDACISATDSRTDKLLFGYLGQKKEFWSQMVYESGFSCCRRMGDPCLPPQPRCPQQETKVSCCWTSRLQKSTLAF